jgi:hypothetical protein
VLSLFLKETAPGKVQQAQAGLTATATPPGMNI